MALPQARVSNLTAHSELKVCLHLFIFMRAEPADCVDLTQTAMGCDRGSQQHEGVQEGKKSSYSPLDFFCLFPQCSQSWPL